MKTSIYSQHHDHTGWLNKLSFYNDEIVLMQKKLDEISSKNTGREIRTRIEHFQNQFTIQKNNSDNIKRHIKREEKELLGTIKKNPVAVDHRKAEDHQDERNMIDGFEQNFNLLRKEFNAFLADRL
jgi:hypothetical protein